MSVPPIPTCDDVQAAQARLAGQIENTPLLRSRTLSQITGAHMALKFENLQFTASFKERGALNRLMLLTADERARGVIATSAGNHAQGVAYHARRLGIAATIVMPENTPSVKVETVRRFGARVVLAGQDFEAASQVTRDLVARDGATPVHPFDDPAIIAGQGTVALEILAVLEDIDDLVVPIGGGGLISGCAIAAKAIRPDIRIVGVQSALYPGMARAIGRMAGAVPGGVSVAEGIAVANPGALTRRIVEQFVDDVLILSEAEIETGIALLLEIEKTVTEGAGAAAVAAVLAHPQMFAGRSVACVLSGGNIDSRVLVTVLQRQLVRAGRLVRLRISTSDRPGALARMSSLIGERGGNILDVQHERAFSMLGAKDVTVQFDIELRDPADLEPLRQDLAREGFISETMTR